jgi:Flp pilus assembly protein TadG
MDLSNIQTWKDGLRVVQDAPQIVLPLLVVVAGGVWWFARKIEKSIRDGLKSQNDALREQNNTLKERLSLAQDRQTDFASKLDAVQTEFAVFKEQVRSEAAPAEIEATANSTSALLGDLKTANTALRHILTAQGGEYGVTGNDVRFTVTRRSDK